jgi:hypothetical protein
MEPSAQPATAPSQKAVAESATSLQGQTKGFPVMPHSNNMIGIPSHSERNSRDRFRPSNGPPIDEWEIVLLGMKLVANNYAQQRRAEIAAGLRSSRQRSHGTLGRLPHEKLLGIEQIVQDAENETVRPQ